MANHNERRKVLSNLRRWNEEWRKHCELSDVPLVTTPALATVTPLVPVEDASSDPATNELPCVLSAGSSAPQFGILGVRLNGVNWNLSWLDSATGALIPEEKLLQGLTPRLTTFDQLLVVIVENSLLPKSPS